MTDAAQIRSLSREEAKLLDAGSAHYMAYVGPPAEYDWMGATQFNLLTTLGLRDHHTLLDFGCGSLRAGRFFLSYLLPSHYFGVEPNAWLIDDAIHREIGPDLIRLKQPRFALKIEDLASEATFDFILAQSIFSHAGRDLIGERLSRLRSRLKPSGLALVTFIRSDDDRDFDGSGWIYPGVVAYSAKTISEMIAEAGFVARALPWFHPRQTWYAAALSEAALPESSADALLHGTTLTRV
jgi:cyclopropane fatty-acyl-phospholipid synthase-like methyltransferase